MGITSYFVSGLAAGSVIDDAGRENAADSDTASGGIQGGDRLPFPRTAAEFTKRIVPADFSHSPGTPERYGAMGDGVVDDTWAIQSCIDCNVKIRLAAGKRYAVTSVSFAPDISYDVDFNGASLIGIASSPQKCILFLPTSYSKFKNIQTCTVNAATIPNRNYACSIQVSNGAGLCQWNMFDGVLLTSAVRGMVYGALPGEPPASGLISENSFYGWRSIGVENPFYSNATEGFAHFSEPIFYSGHERWTLPPNFVTARALEIVAGAVYAQGGELEIPSSASGYAADLQQATLVGMYMEMANPIRITGDGVQITGGTFYNLSSKVPGFTIANGVTGSMVLNGVRLQRQAGVGVYSNAPMIDASRAGIFEVVLANTMSKEWRWSLMGADIRLVITTPGNGTVARYRNHRMQMTAGDPHVYMINSQPTESILGRNGFDHLGYTTDGWTLTNHYGAGTTMGVTTDAGPPGYNASQITLHATGNAQATFGDPSSRASLQKTAVRVRPGELYWISAMCSNSAGSGGSVIVDFYDSIGAAVQTLRVADSGSIPSGSWTQVEAPVAVPAKAAYACPGVFGNVASISITDLRMSRAS